MTTLAPAPAGAPPDRIAVSFEMRSGDVVAATRLQSPRSLVFIAGMGLFVLATSALLFVDGAGPDGWLPGFVIGPLLLLYYPIGLRFFLRRNARSMLGEPVTVVVTADGIEQTMPEMRSWQGWGRLTELRENGAVFLIRRDRLPALFVPKRAFRSKAEEAAFRDLILSHLPRSRALVKLA